MTWHFKKEFPPLLADGLHEMPVAEFRELCVARFPASATRSQLMRGLEELIRRLVAAGIQCEMWIDGSFLTEKLDPEDVDLTLRLEVPFADNMTNEQSNVVDWLIAPDAKNELGCHAFVLVEYPADDPRFAEGDDCRKYWLRQWGVSRNQEKKGIAVIVVLPEVGK